MSIDAPLRAAGGIGEILVQAIERHAESIAVVDRARTMTYAALGRHIAQALEVFREKGVQPGDRIVQIARNRYEVLVTILACYVGGFVSVPLLYSGETEEHAYAIRDCDPAILVLEEEDLQRGAALSAASDRSLTVVTHEALGRRFERGDAPEIRACEAEVDPGACVRMVYTGGTTGRPKGVMSSTSSLAFQCLLLSAAHNFTRETSFLLCAPLSHGAGSFVVPVLLQGGRLVLHSRFDPEEVVDAFRDGVANTTLLVPTMLYAVLDHPRSVEIPKNRLRRLLYGAAPITAPRLRQALDRFGPVLAQSYGQTEVPSAITYLAPEDHMRDPALLSSAGKPYPGVKVRLMADGQLVARRSRTVGEICVQAPHVMLGYWRKPEMTAEAFRDGWLHTGDLAYEDEAGYLFIVDRLKDMVISGGFNIYPSEVEAALVKHAAVQSCALIGVPHEKWGEATHAFVVLRPGDRASETDLKSFVREQLGSIKTPKVIHFVSELPLTKLGKVDKKALRAPFWATSQRHVN